MPQEDTPLRGAYSTPENGLSVNDFPIHIPIIDQGSLPVLKLLKIRTDSMIRLQICQQDEKTEKEFGDGTITIGRAQEGKADIPLDSPSHLNPKHIQIEVKGDRCYVMNSANDPFVSLNKLPFGKRHFHPGDSLQIHNTTIEFLSFAEKSEPLAPLPLEEKNEPIPTKDPLPLPPVLPQQTKPQKASTSALPDPSPEEAAELLKSAKLLSENEDAKLQKRIKIPTKASTEVVEERTWPLPFSLRSFSLTLAALILFFLLAFPPLSFWSHLNEKQTKELTAARSIADISMALLHSQLYPSPLDLQGELSPHLLHRHLKPILSSSTPPFAIFDSGGTLISSGYHIRLLKDETDFWLIATPPSDFWDWISPSKALLLSSKEMKLYETEDLNSLSTLITLGRLDRATKQALNSLTQGKPPLLLHQLDTERSLDFALSTEFSHLNNNFHQRVYNAPRYAKMTTPIVKKMASEEISADELSLFTPLQNAIFYTTLPHYEATEILDTLPENSQLARLITDPETGEILKTEIITREVTQNKTPEWISKLKDLAQNRRETLLPIAKPLLTLIRSHTSKAKEEFSNELNLLIHEYISVDQEEQNTIIIALPDIFAKYLIVNPEGTWEEFLETVQAQGPGSLTLTNYPSTLPAEPPPAIEPEEESLISNDREEIAEVTPRREKSVWRSPPYWKRNPLLEVRRKLGL